MALPNFTALRDLHNSANDLLGSPDLLNRVITGGSHNNKSQDSSKFLFQASEASLRMLDVCGVSRDVLCLVKEHLLDLQFTLRGRRKVSTAEAPDVVIGNKVSAYNDCRKKLRKETRKCLKSLNQMAKKSKLTTSVDYTEYHNHDGGDLAVVAEVLTEVRASTVSIVESLLGLISIPWLDHYHRRQGSGRATSFARRLIRRRSRVCDLLCDETALQTANKRLEAVEIAIEDLEGELECMFRRLIQTRASLLNILTN
ncbi:hypothetical protein LINGRAHAP2_LOCUS35858 [Linum grandiflorum]